MFSQQKNSSIKVHFAVLLALLFFSFSFGAKLNMYELLFSDRGSFFGAGYTDINANIIGYKIIIIGFIIQGLLCLIWAFKKSLKVPTYFFAALMIFSIIK